MYNHKKIEEDILSYWKENDIEKKFKQSAKGDPFHFCDGPPYATGFLHPGTVFNKCLKDAVCRYLISEGRVVRTIPGYDTHGLPIEVKVEKELGIKNKKEIEEIGIENFIEKCRSFANRYIKSMGDSFRRVGVWMDFDHPYLTYTNEYIEKSWDTIKKAWEKGLLIEGDYVVPYCYRCETTLANYELEYGEETDPSIYVKMRAKGKGNEYLVIWTTTPWTLVANLAIMAHPTLKYVKAKVGDEIWILAKSRADSLFEKIGESPVIIEELSGKDLDGIRYEHPFQDVISKEYDRRVVMSDEFVSDEDGSGLVHTAPGTGPEDFVIGKRYGMEPFSPVDDLGRYTSEAGELAGMNVREANQKVISILKSNGSLILRESIRHRYPHCWRCKTPLIFRTTHQWFIKISEVKEKMLSEIEKVNWVPKFAYERFRDFVQNAPDWCISRQRYWGIPLPIWRCEKCGNISVVGSASELPSVPEDLHLPHIDAVVLDCVCGGKMKRIPDILDVWFDSGNAVWASLSKDEKFDDVADLIIEGKDQTRGWFYSLLGSGMIRYSKSPYRAVCMHGFFLDEKGEKMSKSLGNFIPMSDILERSGADAFRLWALSNAFWDDIIFNWKSLKEASRDLNILYNLVVYLQRFAKEIPKKPIAFEKEDKWILSRLNSALKTFHSSMHSYSVHKGVLELRRFLVSDLSRTYLKLAKSRSDVGRLWVIYKCVLALVKSLSSICPFLCEHLYLSYFSEKEGKESVFLHPQEREEEVMIDPKIELQMSIVEEIASSVLSLRQSAGIKTRWPIRTVFVNSEDRSVIDAVSELSSVLMKLTNSKSVSFEGEGDVSQEFSWGNVSIQSKLDDELMEEAMFNEVKRRIQSLRKECGMVESDQVSLEMSGDSYLISIVKKNEGKLIDAVNASSISYNGGSKEFIIDGKAIRISIK